MALDIEIDTQLGERYYRNDKALEDRLTDEIAEIIRGFIDRRFTEGRRPALRDAHARGTGCAKGYFRIAQNIDPSLRHGVFVPGKGYDAWIRFSNGNSELLNERWPDARGMAIKLMGVEGETLIDDESGTQDFVLANNPIFFIDDLQRYKNTLVDFHSGGVVQQLLSSRKLNLREAVLAFKNNFTFSANPLLHQYWSMTAYRLGTDPATKLAIKFTVKPRLGLHIPFLKQALTFFSPNFSLKQEMGRSLARTEILYDFYIQRCRRDERGFIDEKHTPIEDSSVEWKTDLEPVATLIIPSQDIMCFRRDKVCEDLSFNPWHCLAEHRPLGAVNRARRAIYLRMSEHRRKLNRARNPLMEEVS